MVDEEEQVAVRIVLGSAFQDRRAVGGHQLAD
jgi:hypothetical protein